MQEQQHQGVRARFFATAVVLLVSMLMATPAVAADNDTDSTAAEPAPATRPEAEPKCVYGCQRWGKVCNVDPRGVYKCRRICEKFGEICE